MEGRLYMVKPLFQLQNHRNLVEIKSLFMRSSSQDQLSRHHNEDNDLNETMSPEYCCLRSILWLSHYLVCLPTDKMFLSSLLFMKTISNKFHQGAPTITIYFFGGFCRNSTKTFSSFNPRPSLPSVARDDREQSMPTVLNNKTGAF